MAENPNSTNRGGALSMAKIGSDVTTQKDRVKPKLIRPTEEELEQLKAKKEAELERAKAVKEIKDKSIAGELPYEQKYGESPYDSEKKPKVIQLEVKEVNGYTPRVKLPKKKK